MVDSKCSDKLPNYNPAPIATNDRSPDQKYPDNDSLNFQVFYDGELGAAKLEALPIKPPPVRSEVWR